MIASYEGNENVAKLLISKMDNVNARDKQTYYIIQYSENVTALMYSASLNGNENIVKLLIAANADVNARNK